MRVLLDQNVPRQLRSRPGAHEISTAMRMGWSDLTNGELVKAAEAAGFEVLITADRNMRYQQNWSGRRLCVIVLDTNNWTVIRGNLHRVTAALDLAEPGRWYEVVYGA